MPTKSSAKSSKAPARRARAGAGTKSAQQMAALSSIIGRQQLMSKVAGVQYGGKRDIYAAAGYPAQGKVTFDHYWGLYTRGDVAGRIVDMPAKTTWRTPPYILEADKPDGTKFTKEFEALAKRLRLWHYMNRVDRLAGIGRYAVLMIGVRGVDDVGLRQPISNVNGPHDVVYLSVYHEKNAEIKEWETDVSNSRFGLPKQYKLQVSSNSQQFKQNSQILVHASRLLHVAEDLLEDDVYGRPRLERCVNRLFDLDKVASSTGEAYWQMVARILQAKIDPTAEIDDDQMKDLDEKMAEMVHDLRRQFFGQGVNLEWLSSDTPNVQQVADFYFSLIAGASGIPKRILFGSEMGELASTTDQSNYLGQINERQEQFAEPQILRAFIDRMISIKALPAPESGEYQIQWPTLYEETDDAKAAVSLKRAQIAQTLTPVGGNPLLLVEIGEESDVYLVARKPEDPLPEDHSLPDLAETEEELPGDDDEDKDNKGTDPPPGDDDADDPPSGDEDPPPGDDDEDE